MDFPNTDTFATTGVIAIGRNEGDRLRVCLESIRRAGVRIVYVDSGSSDESCRIASEQGAKVISLPSINGFTAARARNAGFQYFENQPSEMEFIQFIDGDCALSVDWLPTAIAFLRAHKDVAVVAGRRRERYPAASIYNRLCDIEWNTPVGETLACGGDALFRVQAFRQVSGFTENLIAGEEPEICVRLRAQGWRIFRLDAEMTLHDAAMLHWKQWFRRSLRSGYAYAEGAALHGAWPERHWVRESRSIWFWGLIWPLVCVALMWSQPMWSILLTLFSYLTLVYRARHGYLQRVEKRADATVAGVFAVLAKFPQVVGQLRYQINCCLGRSSGLVEYKGTTA